MDHSNPYQCLHCGGTPLDLQDDAYACRQCGALFPVMFDVPLLLKSVKPTLSNYCLPRETASQICAVADLPNLKDTDATAESLRQIFAHNYSVDDLNLDAENNYFFNRIPLPEEVKRPPLTVARTTYPVNDNFRYAILDHYVTGSLPRGKVLTRNVRVRNTGDSIISSKTTNPAALSYHWRDAAGGVVEFNGERTLLPIDLLPGRALTVPTVIKTPRRAGTYMLELTMAVGDRWLDRDAITVGVDVVQSGSRTVPAHWIQTRKPQETYNYADDHLAARELLFREIERHQHPGLRILEVGGCCSPYTGVLPCDVYSMDIDIQTLQVGQLTSAGRPGRLQFVAADVHDLPFADQSFDCVVMFSALHHFARPVDALRQARRVLKRDGFLAVLCEPVGCYLNGRVSAEFVRELQQGINEQIFTAEEYNQMFLRAGLYSPWVELDRGSLKAFLRAEGAGQATSRWSRLWQGWRASRKKSA